MRSSMRTFGRSIPTRVDVRKPRHEPESRSFGLPHFEQTRSSASSSRALSFAAVLLVCLVPEIGAQEEAVLSTGDRIRVRTESAPDTWLVGTLAAPLDSELVLDRGAEASDLRLSPSAVRQIEVSRGRESRWLLGGGIGLAAGAAAGAVYAAIDDCGDSPEPGTVPIPTTCPFSGDVFLTAIFALPAAGLGALVGHLAPAEEWEPVDEGTALTVGPTSNGRWGVGVSLQL